MQTVLLYFRESFQELKTHVRWTPRNELQNLVIIVVVFSVLFAVAIWGADTLLSRIVRFYFEFIK